MTEGQPVADTTLKEFKEEALRGDDNKLSASFYAKLDAFFLDKKKCRQVYAGYVDDPRNTDNAWMETHANHFHIPSSEVELVNMKLLGGDDALKAMWVDYSPALKMYASHEEWVHARSTRLPRACLRRGRAQTIGSRESR